MVSGGEALQVLNELIRTTSTDAVEPAPAMVPLWDRMDKILGECFLLAREHRTSVPPLDLSIQVQRLSTATKDLFQDWTLSICALLDRESVLRYGELKSRLPGISTRTLAEKLVHLTTRGYVVREFFNEIPPRVEYRLTAEGRQFLALVTPLLLFVARAPDPASPEAKFVTTELVSHRRL
jgi:DNA-binding HxlR family transcriptional regulator